MKRLVALSLMIAACLASVSRADSRLEQIWNGMVHISGSRYGQHTEQYQYVNTGVTPAEYDSSDAMLSDSNGGTYGGMSNFHYGDWPGSDCCGNPWAGYCGERKCKKFGHAKCWKPRCGVKKCCKPASCGSESPCSTAPSCGAEVSCGAAPSCDTTPSCGSEPTCGMAASCGCQKKCHKPLFAGCHEWLHKVRGCCHQAFGCGCGCEWSSGSLVPPEEGDESTEQEPPMAPPMPEAEQTTHVISPLRAQLAALWGGA